MSTSTKQSDSHHQSLPDSRGHFGQFGGIYVPETLVPVLLQVEQAYQEASHDPDFQKTWSVLARDYIGRPSPLYFARRTTEYYQTAKIYFKREELNHTGAHKINNCLGQVLLAKRMGKTRIIAETGAGQHGVATATACALLNMQCEIFMGAKDMQRQAPNVFRMKLLGARVHSVPHGTGTLKDAMNEALRDWANQVEHTFYVVGTAAGPHPYPKMVRDFQKIIGEELKQQILEKEQRLPSVLIACIGGGSNAIGMMYPFLDDKVRLIGVEAAGKGLDTSFHAASISGGTPGVLHGNCTYLLQDKYGQIRDAHSISAGLDYPGIGPEHAWLHQTGRVAYVAVTDQEALDAFQQCCRLEGIIPALEPAHALAYLDKLAPQLSQEDIVVLNLCGRGDKDIFNVADALHMDISATDGEKNRFKTGIHT